MKAFILLLFAVAICSNLRDAEFSSFMKNYGKTYSSVEEQKYRLSVFNANVKKINEHNAKKLSWTLGVNAFADLTEEEFEKKFVGATEFTKGEATEGVASSVKIPEKLDWRDEGMVTPVKDTMSTTVWQNAVTDAVESANAISTKKLIQLSVNQLDECVPRADPADYTEEAFAYAAKHGMCTSADYPYDHSHHECKDSQCKVAAKMTGYVKVTPGDEEALADAVAKTPTSVIVDGTSIQFYKGGIITKCGEMPNHLGTIVGYGSADDTKYWIVKNVWGASWGEKGYYRVEKDVGGYGRCGIAYRPIYPQA